VHQVALHGIGFMFLSLHVIVPDKRHGEGWCHCSREGQSKYIQRSHFRLILRKGFFGKMRHVLSQSSKDKPPFYVYCACAGTG
jgi:hypothetical protein